MRQIALHPSDVAVALCLSVASASDVDDLGYREIGERVRISHGEAHNAIKRLRVARLVAAHSHMVAKSFLVEFLLHGVRYAFPPMLGAPTRGVPTGPAAPLLGEGFSGEAEMLVWPSAEGAARGASLVPLIPSAPDLPAHNPALYELLVIVDVLRVGRSRERRVAETLLRSRLRADSEAET